jgi:hypothetical protein
MSLSVLAEAPLPLEEHQVFHLALNQSHLRQQQAALVDQTLQAEAAAVELGPQLLLAVALEIMALLMDHLAPVALADQALLVEVV